MTDIAKKYRKLTDVEHVLKVPGRYVGVISARLETVNLLLQDKIRPYNVTYNPGFIKLFDEIISNSVDEHKRNPKLNKIDVTVDKATGYISVRDNGGIPVVEHPEHKEWIPQFIFSNLRAGSNFDDEEKRTCAGVHGEGATLTNIFSKVFIVETSDGKNKYIQEYKDNLSITGVPKITKSSDNYTIVKYLPDYERFKLTGINDANFHMLRKRVIDIAACNRGVVLTFYGEKFEFSSFKHYIKLYTDEELIFEESKHWKFALGTSDDGFKIVAFVNSVETRDGGTHVDYIIDQITEGLRVLIKKKHKMDLKPSELKKSMTLYLDATVINNMFNSQTKEKLITEQKDFGTYHTVSDMFIKKVFQSEIVKRILDWIDKKQLAEERAEQRKLNKNISKTKVIKLIDAKKTGDRSKCILGVFEGDCLDENTLVKVYNDYTLVDVKMKDLNAGDFVLTHKSQIKEILQVTKKIEKVFKIVLDGEEVVASENHSFYVYDKLNNIFDWISLKEIMQSDYKNRYKLLKNRLTKLESLEEIISVTSNNDEKYKFKINLNDSNKTSFLISEHGKFAIFDIEDNTFKMIIASEVKSSTMLFVNIAK